MVGSGRFVGWLAVGTGGRVVCAGVIKRKNYTPMSKPGCAFRIHRGYAGFMHRAIGGAARRYQPSARSSLQSRERSQTRANASRNWRARPPPSRSVSPS